MEEPRPLAFFKENRQPQGLGSLGDDSVFPRTLGLRYSGEERQREASILRPLFWVLQERDEESSGRCQPKAAFPKLGVPWTISFALSC